MKTLAACLLGLVLCLPATGQGKKANAQKPVFPFVSFNVTMRRADDPKVKGDLLHVTLYLTTVGVAGAKPPFDEHQEVDLTEDFIMRCTGDIGTLFSSTRYSTRDEDLTFRINPNAGLITVETGSTQKESWRFEYAKSQYTSGYDLKEASMVTVGYNVTEKRMTSTEWTAIKGSSATMPWPCPMGIFPIYSDNK